MKTLLWSALLSCALGTFSALATPSIFHVDPSGSDVSGDGTWSNPYATISHAYSLACSNNGRSVVYALPGTYTETNTLVLTTTNVLLRGAGPEQSFLDMNVDINEDAVLAELCVEDTFSNTACAILHNVKLVHGACGDGLIIGSWRGAYDELHLCGLADPSDPLDAVNYQSMSGHVQQAMAVFVSDAKLTDEEWVEGYVASNSLQVEEGVLDLSGVVISNVVDILCQPREPVTSGTVYSVYYDAVFDCLVSEAPPAGITPGYVQFTTGALSGQVFAIESCSSGSWNGSGYFAYSLPGQSLQQLSGGDKYQTFQFEPIHESFVRSSGDSMRGSLGIGGSLEVTGETTFGSNLSVAGTASIADPVTSNHAVNVSYLQRHVDTALTAFVDKAELADQTWVSEHVASNSLQVQEGVLDLSGVVISNVVDVFCQPQEALTSGSVHEVASFCDDAFDVLAAEAPAEWESPSHILFISGLLSGQVFAVWNSSSGSWNGAGYYT